nr:MAG TPA: TmCorA-like maritima CorA-like family [Inoviridae sp.]
MTVSVFLTDICDLISGVFSAVFAQPLLAFFMTATLLAVVAGLFLYIYRRSKRF